MPTGTLPASGKALWEKVYEQAKSGSCKDSADPEACAAKSAWAATKSAGWKKDADGKWTKKAELTEFSLIITKASFDKASQEMRWLASASDTGEDSYKDNMTYELFQDFLTRIETNELAPEEFRSDFWQGGKPYLSISHYLDLNGDAVPGNVEVVYIDGDYLKAKGTYNDTPLGRACFKSICEDLYSKERSETQDRVRISIAFLDWMHKHKSNGFIFERKSLEDFCPECLRELIHGEHTGISYLRGQLVHLAHTRVPINKRTLMEVDRAMTTKKEDAASIVGEELAEELEEKSKLVGKSEALVIKAEDEDVEDATPAIETPAPIIEEAKSGKPSKDDEDMDTDSDGDDEADEKDGKYKKEYKKKSIATDEVLEVVKSLAVDVAQLKAAVIVETPTHPLHDSLETFKSDYSAALEMSDLNADEKLRLIQQSFDALGQKVIETIKAPQPAPEPSPVNDMAKAFSEALQPLMLSMEMLNTKIQQLEAKAVVAPAGTPPAPVIPQRRSITPNLQMQSVVRSGVSETARKSETPNLRSIIERTT